MAGANFSLVNKTRGRTPRLPFKKMKNAVLGEGYELSVALLLPAEAKRITRATKNKNSASNVLAFPLSKKSGELLLCPATARIQAPQYGYGTRTFLARLFIHGLLHLKRRSHGATMEREESGIAERFGF